MSGKIVSAQDIEDDSTWWNMVVDVDAARIMGRRPDGDLRASAAPSSTGCNVEPARAELARRATLEADPTPDELRVSERYYYEEVRITKDRYHGALFRAYPCVDANGIAT